MKVSGDASTDPHEFFSHYDAYSFWLSKKIKEMGGGGETFLIQAIKK